MHASDKSPTKTGKKRIHGIEIWICHVETMEEKIQLGAGRWP